MRCARLLLGSALALLVGCAPGSSTDSGEQQSAWGHLSELSPTAPQFLVNKKRGETFRVCMPRYMTASFPGVKAEVEAAVNVWGAYIGRTVPVEIEEADLPRATSADSPNALMATYYGICGEGFDVVMGLAPLGGTTVGQTGFETRMFSDGRVDGFRRYLFLRDYSLAPSTSYGFPASWISLQARTGRTTDARELLAHMQERNEVQYRSRGAGLTLPVLTHEIGHVWGMCDQYEGAPGCDPQNSTSHPVADAVMGARSIREPIFLTDDDVTGIRRLAGREGFAHDWDPPPSAPPAPIRLPDPELARIDHVRRDPNVLVLSYGLVTRQDTRTEFFVRPQGTVDWTAVGAPTDSAGGVDAPVVRLSIQLGSTPQPPLEVRLRVSLRGEDGSYTEAAVVDGHE